MHKNPFLLVVTALLSACATGPDISLEPRYGLLELDDTSAAQHKVSIVSGGNNAAAFVLPAGCQGSIANAPDYRVQFNGSSDQLVFSVTAPGDTTLVINSATGDWICDDDSGGGYDPRITLHSPSTGQYDIWVGSFISSDYLNSVLTIEHGAEVGEVASRTEKPRSGADRPAISAGTGFFVASNGYLVTNNHVIEGAREIQVLVGATAHPAELIAADPANDLAILKIDAETRPLAIRSAREVRRGEDIFTLGYPLSSIQGASQRASFGKVNSLSGILDDVRFLQIDAPILPGNSGGPVVGPDGTVIGVVAARLDALTVLEATGTLPENVSYAVKSDYLFPLLPADARLSSTSLSGEPADMIEAAESSVVPILAR
jgi:S1-C subfamily serine protease